MEQNQKKPHARWGRRALAVVALTITSIGLASQPAGAATRQWNTIPSHGTGSGWAIIDSHNPGYLRSSAQGRVQLTARSYCVRVQYAPYAVAAVDGGWKSLPWNCTTNATRTYSWSDTFYLAYNGFKFRICTTTSCGAVRYIRF